jgi:glycosyltransferase involved in cell wall biosynthesis
VKELRLGDQVAMPGFFANPFPAIRAGDVFVQASVSEGSPLAVLEAMALERPIVATEASGAVREVIDHGSTGLVVPDGDVEELAAGIERMLADSDLARRLGAAARARARSHHSPQAVASRYCEFFASLTQR